MRIADLGVSCGHYVALIGIRTPKRGLGCHTQHVSPDRQPYSDTRELIEDSLEVLAQLRGKWLGDDLVAIALLAGLMDEAERTRAGRVAAARAGGPRGPPSRRHSIRDAPYRSLLADLAHILPYK